MNPDLEYDLGQERAIIADLDRVDQIKAELAQWKKGPWVLKSHHDEVAERFSNIAKAYQKANEEAGRLRQAIRLFRSSTGAENTAAAIRLLFEMVPDNAVQPSRKGGER
jgi:vacuolar-type H+-ATPase subunit D/Vma8